LLGRLDKLLLVYNTEDKGHLIDDFISKFIILAGTVCSDTPANIPILIKNGVIPTLIKSLE
jgi:hypothetical protein